MSAITASSLPMSSTAQADIVVFSRDKRPILIVEVKDTGAYTTPESAAGVRRSLMAHSLLPDAPFFMLVTAFDLFLWPKNLAPRDPPGFTASSLSILNHYASHRSNRVKPGRGGALDIVIFSWLSDLASGIRSPSADSPADHMLIESGVYQQIQGGTADYEVQL